MATNAIWSADIRSEATFSAFAGSETGGWEFGHLRARGTLECAGPRIPNFRDSGDCAFNSKAMSTPGVRDPGYNVNARGQRPRLQVNNYTFTVRPSLSDSKQASIIFWTAAPRAKSGWSLTPVWMLLIKR